MTCEPIQLALAPLSEAGAIRNTVPTATPEAEAPPAGVPDSSGGRLRERLAERGWTISRFLMCHRVYPKALSAYRAGRAEPADRHVDALRSVLGIDRDEAIELLKEPTDCRSGKTPLPLYVLANRCGVGRKRAASSCRMTVSRFSNIAQGRAEATEEEVGIIAAGLSASVDEVRTALEHTKARILVSRECRHPIGIDEFDRPPLLGDKDPEFRPAQEQLRKVMRIAADRSIRGIRNAACYERLRVVAQAGDQFNAWLEPEEQDFLFKLNALLERFAETRLREAA